MCNVFFVFVFNLSIVYQGFQINFVFGLLLNLTTHCPVLTQRAKQPGQSEEAQLECVSIGKTRKCSQSRFAVVWSQNLVHYTALHRTARAFRKILIVFSDKKN